MVKNLKKTVAQKVMVGKKSDNSAHKRKLIPSIALACAFAVIIVSGTVYVAYNAFSASNCANMQSGTELCIDSFTPDSGSVVGNNWVTINGTGFLDNGKTSDYVTDANFTVHYDGINNVGLGDLNHSFSNGNTLGWTNLRNNAVFPRNAYMPTGIGGWTKNGWTVTNSAGFWSSSIPAGFVTGSAARTVEIVYTTPANGITQQTNSSDGNTRSAMFGYGKLNETGAGRLWYQYGSATRLYAPDGWGINRYFDKTSHPSLFSASTFNAFSMTYSAGGNIGSDSVYNSYLNGSTVTSSGLTAGVLNTATSGQAFIGGYNQASVAGSAPQQAWTIHSLRMYNRVLTADEVAKNAVVDKNRFKNPLAVTIGGETCADAVILSDTQLKCKAPAEKSANILHDVEVTYQGETVTAVDKYKYTSLDTVSVSPNTGSIQGGNIIVVNGENFPYAGVTEYVANGLVAHYDGIDNQALGDQHHLSDNATDKGWVNLVTDIALPRNNNLPSGNGGWVQNGWNVTNNAGFFQSSVPDGFPVGSSARTLEIIYTTPTAGIATSTRRKGLFGYGNLNNGDAGTESENARGQRFWMQYDNTDLHAPDTWGNNFTFTQSAFPIAFQGNKLLTLSATYAGTKALNAQGTAFAFLNGAPVTPSSLGSYALNTLSAGGKFFIGGYNLADVTGAVAAPAWTIHSLRIYDRVLSPLEIQQNAYLDQLRFLSPPVVKIGTQSCTNVVVLSTTKLQCTVPKVQSASTENITVYDSTDTELANPKTLTDAYTYVNEQSMSITTIDPKVGPSFGGSKIRLTGKNLDILKVTIAGKECTDPVLAEKTTYTCTVPSIDITQDTFVDVVVTPNSGNNYVFAQGFQYIFARRGPVEFNVE
ncbi:MAG: IPT/TIG domain-containing protein [Bifidobacteriaceae bacterium]|jgi:hypothetical protein|nr:IPT/TIG domain-containing protein [Bifidobacteriaceae bacterium]